MPTEVIRIIQAGLCTKRQALFARRLAVVVAVVLVVSIVVGRIVAFIQPASASAAGISAQYNYCTHWAARNLHVGTATAGPCGVVLVGVHMSPSDMMTYTGDAYAPGNCTYWAALRRGEIGKPIPNNWGDAYMWAGNASADGYTVDHTPVAGAIMQTSGGSLGHVAFVESVAKDGTWRISEMNVIGLGEVDNRTLPAAQAADYMFIH